MSEQINYDFETLKSGAQALSQFGQSLTQMGRQFKQIHQQLQDHCSGDESGIGSAVVDATSETAEAGADVFSEGGRVLSQMGSRTESNAGRAQYADETIAKTFDGMHNESEGEQGPAGGRGGAGSPGAGSEGSTPRAEGDGINGSGERPVSGEDGQSSTTPSDEVTDCKDPIDVVSGMMFLTLTDVRLPGLLPLVLSRTFRSNYRKGGWFGPRWASSLDQRVEVDADGVHFAAEDGVVLHYPLPSRPSEGLLPVAGPHRPLTWDRAADVISIADPGTGRTLQFAASGGPVRPVSELVHRNGHRITFVRDEFGLPSEVRHSGGYRIAIDTVETRAGTRISGLRLLDGTANGAGTTIVTFGYDPLGNLVETVNSSGLPLVYEYDREGRIIGWIDRNGSEYRYTYDDAGRVVATSGSDGMLSGSMSYDVERRITYSTNSLGQVTEYHWDENDRVAKTVTPSGAVMLDEWDSAGRLLSQTDPVGGVLRFTYDEDGNRISAEQPDGARVSTLYDAHGLPARVTGPDGGVWQYAYDEAGNLVSVIEPDGARISYAYDEAGGLAEIVDRLGRVRRIECNAAGLPIATTDALGATVRYRRDAFGRVVEAVDQAGGVTRFGWSVEGRPLWRVGPDGARIEFAYDAEGNQTLVRNAAGAETAIEYTHFDLPAAKIDPGGVRYEFGYDTELRLTSVINPLGLQWCYTYDEAGNLAREVDFDGRVVEYRYDEAGRMVGRVLPSGRTVEYTLDIQGRVIEQRAGDEVERFEFDRLGRLARASNADAELEFEYDAAGNVVSEAINGRVTRHVYDAAGQRVRRTTPSGAVTEWTYDPLGAPSALCSQAGGLVFEHDAAGRETARHLGPNTAVTRSWDVNHRLTGTAVWHRLGTEGGADAEYQLLQQHGYAYRSDGMVQAIADRLGGDQTLALDPAGRVTSRAATGWNENYTYDVAGNITARHAGGSGAYEDGDGAREYEALRIRRAGRLSYEYDEDGRLVASVRRTLSGKRLVWRYVWNGFDRLVRVETPDGSVWRYRYDPLGRRIAKANCATDGTVLSETLFSWDDTRLAEQVDADPATGAPRAVTWDYLPGTDEPVAQSVTRRPAGGATGAGGTDALDQDEVDRRFYAIVTDLIGMPRELLTPEGELAWRITPDTWGRVLFQIQAEVDCPLRFPGQYHDAETGLHYNFFRFYDPATGRYITADPLGLEPGPDHRAYVVNPLAWTDPLGLASCLSIPDEAWDHVFKGEFNKANKAVGYHSRPGGADRYGVRTTLKSEPDEDGVYTGTVTKRDWDGNTWVQKTAQSSFFPDNWSEDQVRHAITRAVTEGSIIKDADGNPTEKWEGTYRGIKIQGYYDPVTKAVKTAFPVYKKK